MSQCPKQQSSLVYKSKKMACNPRGSTFEDATFGNFKSFGVDKWLAFVGNEGWPGQFPWRLPSAIKHVAGPRLE